MIFFSHKFFQKKHCKLKNVIIVKIRTFLFLKNFTFIKTRGLYCSPGKKDFIAYRSIYQILISQDFNPIDLHWYKTESSYHNEHQKILTLFYI